MKKYDPLIFVKQSQLEKAEEFINLAVAFGGDKEMVNFYLQNALVELSRRPTKRAVDEGDSVPLQAESTPEHLPIEEADTTPALRN